MSRVIWIVLDSVGMGEMPDAARFHDEGSNTLYHVWEKCNGLKIPNMIKLGLGNIEGMKGITKTTEPLASYARIAEQSNGKDTTVGHWEMIGIISAKAFPTYPNGFPEDIIQEFIDKAGVGGVLGNCVASGTEIIKRLGEKHLKTGYPIIYTSADSVFQIAANEKIIPPDRLYEICRTARKILHGDNEVSRVIARPFVEKDGVYERTSNRRDFSILPPSDNLLVKMKHDGLDVIGVGKIEDIFAGEGITEAIHTKNNMHGVDETIRYMKEENKGLIFTNLVEFDSKWGHRNDWQGYGKGLEEFDARLPEIIGEMHEDDVLIINADHGCDPVTPSTDHSREYIPMLLYSPKFRSVDLKTRNCFSDIGQTIAQMFGIDELPAGTSFLDELKEE